MVFLGVPEVAPKGTEVFALEFSVAPSNFTLGQFFQRGMFKKRLF